MLCPPQLAEQWQAELRDKFHIEAELVLPGTAARLERGISLGQSLFDIHPFVIVSMDFIKTDRRRDEFLRTCPELVIVDEAHTCASGVEHGGHHQRHKLVAGLAENPLRHIILVTATPHSGKEEAFRSLLTILDTNFQNLPDDLGGAENERYRRQLAAHFVQRRRADIRHYMDADTPFPERLEGETSYKLSPEYKRLFERVLEYARETVRDTGETQFHQRVKWWSALALLRSLASSPLAAASTLRNRAATIEAGSAEEADEIGRRTILDMMEDESAEGIDVAPGSDLGEEDLSNHRRLLDMARMADALAGDKDEKLKQMVRLVKDFLAKGYRPILFCRFIPTAEYVAAELRKELRGVEVAAVTGTLPPEEREARVLQLAESEKRVLVCTDCLSEGVNLQAHFDAVIHYDLSWNPTRHEQREGRVDRYGQQKKNVRMLTYYGTDNQIDGIVLDVLLRKHKAIRNSLGISVPVPVDTEKVVEAIFEGLLLRSKPTAMDNYLPGFDEFMRPTKQDLNSKWEAASEREKRSRTLFAQVGIKVEEVGRELHDAQEAVGSGVDVSGFVKESLQALGAGVTGNGDELFANLAELQPALRDRFTIINQKVAVVHLKFSLPVDEKQILLTRTHPFVETIANHVTESALDPLSGDELHKPPARRCGAIRTKEVQIRTTLLLVRFRYHIISLENGVEKPLLAEDCHVLAFTGAPDKAQWLDESPAMKLLTAQPDANISEAQAGEFVGKVIEGYSLLEPHLNDVARQRGEDLLDAHQRVRRASKVRNVHYRVEPQLPPDVLGIYLYLPIIK